MVRAVKHHNIKILPQFFEDTSCGRKSFEIRKDDRDYQIGDTVTMHEWTPDAGFYFCALFDGNYEEERRLYDYADKIEVIGNIFDNPELLEPG